MSTEINWQEPPASERGKGGKWVRITVELKKDPGRWALVGENVRTGICSLLKRHGLEVQSVSAGKGYVRGYADIYARWPESTTTKETD